MNFDLNAKAWDNDKRIKRAKIISEKIYDVIGTKKISNALEFGCGTGLISFNLYNKFDYIDLVDTSKGMIEVLNVKIKENKISNMLAYNIDIDNERSLDKNKYDLIYTSMAMHHIIDIDKTLDSLYSLLKEDGIICIVDLDEEDGSFHKNELDFKGHNGFRQSELRSKMARVGFEKVISNTFYKDEKLVEGKSIKYSLFIMTGEKCR